MTIKEVFKTLNLEQRNCLMSSFDKMEYCILELGEGRIICCHPVSLEGFVIEDQSEFWLIGKFKGEN